MGGYLYDMTVFVGPEMVNFPAPPKPDPKISQRALSPDMFPNKGLNASLLQPIPPSCEVALVLQLAAVNHFFKADYIRTIFSIKKVTIFKCLDAKFTFLHGESLKAQPVRDVFEF